jgi:hypothetical protein
VPFEISGSRRCENEGEVFWVGAPSSAVEAYRRLRGEYRLIMDTVRTSELSVCSIESTWHYNPEDCHLQGVLCDDGFGIQKVLQCAHIIISGAGVAQSVTSLDYRLGGRVPYPAEAKDFSSSLCVQTSSEAHPASYPMDTVVFPGNKERPGSDADHSPLSGAKVRKD